MRIADVESCCFLSTFLSPLGSPFFMGADDTSPGEANKLFVVLGGLQSLTMA